MDNVTVCCNTGDVTMCHSVGVHHMYMCARCTIQYVYCKHDTVCIWQCDNVTQCARCGNVTIVTQCAVYGRVTEWKSATSVQP